MEIRMPFLTGKGVLEKHHILFFTGLYGNFTGSPTEKPVLHNLLKTAQKTLEKREVSG